MKEGGVFFSKQVEANKLSILYQVPASLFVEPAFVASIAGI